MYSDHGNGSDLLSSRTVELFPGYPDLHYGSEIVLAAVSAVYIYQPGKFSGCDGKK